MRRVLLLATTTGYQTRAFGDAAERLGVDLIFATDRCTVLEDPWQDDAIPVRFYDEADSAATILSSARERPIDGVLAVGDRPTVIAALVNEGLGLPGHPPEAAEAARNKLLTRERLRSAGLPVPWFVHESIAADPHVVAASLSYPCVVKPIALSGSRGVMRANTQAELVAALYRLRALLQAPDIRAERNEAHDDILIEGFIEGHEFAVEGIMNRGELHVLALFDKPDPLDGPFFEETIYVTESDPLPATTKTQSGTNEYPGKTLREPSCLRGDSSVRRDIERAVMTAANALGLQHGPIHAECRVDLSKAARVGGVFVLEVAARPIGGICARALRFVKATDPATQPIPLEELLLRHALGECSTAWTRERPASGVMMIPIPRRGIFRGVAGVDAARAVALVTDIRITAKADQLLLPLPEGASYLGFIFARGATADGVTQALRDAHACLQFAIDPEVRVLQSVHG